MIPARKPDSYLICNLDKSHGGGGTGGTHWVCRYVTPQGKALWHDPLGKDGAQQASALVQQVSAQWTEDDAEQAESEDNCGQRCLAALRIAKEMGPSAFLLL